MRLTAELVRNAPAYMNPLGERELNLRGFKIPLIENLGVTQDHYQFLDLSDNELEHISNFPILKRLQTLVANNNKIAQLARGLGQLLPKLENLILANNKIGKLEELAPLGDIPTLKRVSLSGNPIVKHRHYRYYVIHKLPKLKVLDFEKVKPKERQAAEKLFGGDSKESKAMDDEDSSFTPGVIKKRKMTAEEKKKILEAIQKATSADELDRLEQQLAAGEVPV
mmetsp:Transcript_7165/g.9830  ORF Transcript_7165/g.9830 Transcript_7165/m.9830 type:complete len:224 (-) Transcript_7165:349-1020(-)